MKSNVDVFFMEKIPNIKTKSWKNCLCLFVQFVNKIVVQRLCDLEWNKKRPWFLYDELRWKPYVSNQINK